MPTYNASIDITAPREAVWRVLGAVTAWPQWLPTVTSVGALDAASLTIGARYAVRQPRLRPATWTVTTLDEPNHFVWQARSPGLLMIAAHTIEQSSPGNCRVLLSFTFAGLLGGFIGRLFRSTTERYLAQEVAALKFAVEGQH